MYSKCFAVPTLASSTSLIGRLRWGRDSIFVKLMFRKANADSTLNSTDVPLSWANTMLVLNGLSVRGIMEFRRACARDGRRIAEVVGGDELRRAGGVVHGLTRHVEAELCTLFGPLGGRGGSGGPEAGPRRRCGGGDGGGGRNSGGLNRRVSSPRGEQLDRRSRAPPPGKPPRIGRKEWPRSSDTPCRRRPRSRLREHPGKPRAAASRASEPARGALPVGAAGADIEAVAAFDNNSGGMVGKAVGGVARGY
ncbi:hypothetical protein G2W53_021419 [Senna tora]|uniref:Uncharacterized protein n=1 Tax=Senna tora TaxID=362788 RepID=A0A834TK49_9FABA|nr:hypothetical protein G2W53_021419 [Senna tora]